MQVYFSTFVEIKIHFHFPTHVSWSRHRKWPWTGDDDLSSLSEEGEKARPAKTKVWSWEAEGPKWGLHFSSNDRWEVRTTHCTEWWGHGHRYHDYHQQYCSDWGSQWDTWEGTPQEKTWVTKDVLDLCDERRDLKKKRYEAEGAKEYREANRRIQKAVKKAKEDWIGVQCEETETCLNKNNSKREHISWWRI